MFLPLIWSGSKLGTTLRKSIDVVPEQPRSGLVHEHDHVVLVGQDLLAGEVVFYARRVEVHRGTPQEILVVHVPQGLDAHRAVHDLAYGRKSLVGDLAALADIDHAAHLGTSGGGDRDEYLVDPVLF